MIYAVVFILSYLIGNINPAIHVAKWRRGVDIRKVNSLNAGTSNVAMTVGYRWGITVGLLDIFKGLLPVLIVRLLSPGNDILWFLSGLAVILGHVYPAFHGFKGGKGSATFGGVLFATMPLFAFVLLIVYFLIMYVTDYIALSTLFATIVTPIAMYFFDFHWISICLMLVFTVISFKKHYVNYRRILKGDEVGIRKFNRNKDKIRVGK